MTIITSINLIKRSRNLSQYISLTEGYLDLSTWSRIDIEELSVTGRTTFTVTALGNISHDINTLRRIPATDMSYIDFEM